jgi:flagellar hook protein FlgE
VGLNLDSRATVPTTALFNPTDPTSYNNSTAMTIFDSLGNNHIATLYFQKAAAPVNTWNSYMTVDNLPTNGVATVPPSGTSLGTLTFSSTGLLTAPALPVAVPAGGIVYANGSTTPQPMTMDFAASTQFGAPFGVNTLNQNGYTSGQLNGFSTSADGTIMGRYTNGQSQPLGQVLLVNFTNPQGLQPLGNNEWSSTATSGQPLVGVPGTSSLGILQSGATEDSNIDLTAELVNMITAQRVYQANAQTIKAQDSILQTITNLR